MPHDKEDISGDPPLSPHDPSGQPAPAESAQSKSLKALEQVRDARELLRRMVDAIETDGRFPVEAYIFLQEGLEFSVKRFHGAASPKPPQQQASLPEPVGAATQSGVRERTPQHVDGRQLCRGLRELAIQRWGRMAKAVLNGWGIHRTNDFGEMVFVLVDNQFLQKTEGDRIEDFADVFPFRELEADYKIEPGKIDAVEVHVR